MAFGPRAFLKREDSSMASDVQKGVDVGAQPPQQKRFEPYQSSAQFVPFYASPSAMFYGGGQKRFDYAYGPAKRFEYDGYFPFYKFW